jgi:hypothetical protein
MWPAGYLAPNRSAAPSVLDASEAPFLFAALSRMVLHWLACRPPGTPSSRLTLPLSSRLHRVACPSRHRCLRSWQPSPVVRTLARSTAGDSLRIHRQINCLRAFLSSRAATRHDDCLGSETSRGFVINHVSSLLRIRVRCHNLTTSIRRPSTIFI